MSLLAFIQLYGSETLYTIFYAGTKVMFSTLTQESKLELAGCVKHFEMVQEVDDSLISQFLKLDGGK